MYRMENLKTVFNNKIIIKQFIFGFVFALLLLKLLISGYLYQHHTITTELKTNETIASECPETINGEAINEREMFYHKLCLYTENEIKDNTSLLTVFQDYKEEVNVKFGLTYFIFKSNYSDFFEHESALFEKEMTYIFKKAELESIARFNFKKDNNKESSLTKEDLIETQVKNNKLLADIIGEFKVKNQNITPEYLTLENFISLTIKLCVFILFYKFFIFLFSGWSDKNHSAFIIKYDTLSNFLLYWITFGIFPTVYITILWSHSNF